MSPDALADKTCGGTHNGTTADGSNATLADASALRDQQQLGDAAGSGSGNSVLWWGMTEPLSLMRLKGFVWYQGGTTCKHSTACSWGCPDLY